MKLTRDDVPFTQIANEVLFDKRLSCKAKGIFAYMFAKPDDWDFAAERIANDCSDGRKAVLGGLRELEDAGYLVRSKQPDGKVEYRLKFVAEPKSPNGTQALKARVPKRHSAQTAPITNKEEEQTKNSSPTAREFFESHDLQERALKWMESKKISRPAAEAELAKFIAYWNEPNHNKTKVRWQGEKFFDPGRRLVTWCINVQRFSGKQTTRSNPKIASMPSTE